MAGAKLEINTGDVFGRLTILDPFVAGKKAICLARCECGNTKELKRSNVYHGASRSCGCLFIDMLTTHGKYKTRTHRSWNGMKDRCRNPNNPRWDYYGGRGIKYDKRWESFELFLLDMGDRPKGKTLDRKDNDGDYTKDNCRWATPVEQQNNMKSNHVVEWNGKTMNVSQWAVELNINSSTLFKRLKRGWSIDRALST